MNFQCPCGRTFGSGKGLALHARGCDEATPEVRFWAKVVKTSSCWNWIGACRWDGYGRLWWDGRQTTANRISWELANGRLLRPGEHVLHSCDNPACVNPAHLSVGTHQENVADRDRKGRGRHRYTPIPKLLHPHRSRRLNGNSR